MYRALFFVLALFCVFPAFSQLVNKGSVISVSSDAHLTTAGEIVNEGTIVNNGAISIRKDWTNTGMYLGDGRLIASGSQLQQIRHNGDAVNNFRILNPNGARLQGNLPITGMLDLSLGNIITTPSDTLLIRADADITPGSFSSFIDGPLHQEGTGLKVFPIGVGRDFRPIVLRDVRGEGTVTRLWVQRDLPYEDDQNAPPPPPGGKKKKPKGIANLSAAFFWERENYNAPFLGSSLTLPFTDEMVPRERAAIVSFNADGTSSILSEVELTEGEYFTEITSLDEFYGEILVLGEIDETLADEVAFYVPNALNPGAMEEENQVIRVYGNVLDDGFLYVVYDRRGLEIFRTEDLTLMQTSGWNGTYTGSGRRVPAGAYVYAVKGFTLSGNVINQTGSLIIVQ